MVDSDVSNVVIPNSNANTQRGVRSANRLIFCMEKRRKDNGAAPGRPLFGRFFTAWYARAATKRHAEVRDGLARLRRHRHNLTRRSSVTKMTFNCSRSGVLGTLMLLCVPHSGWADSSVTLSPVVVTADHAAHSVSTEADPRQARQPLPASDAGDFLKGVPGFAAIRSGGTNGDPVLRGMMGSRLNLLVDGGQIIGACPGRMDSPSSYLSPETYDHFEVVKGPQTVVWGPTGSAGTVLFERRTERFQAPGQRGRLILQGGSHGRGGAMVDVATGSESGYLRAIGQYDRADDYRDGNGDRVPSRWMKWNGDLLFGLTPDADTLIELGVGAGDGEARYAGRGMDGSKFERRSATLRVQRAFYGGALETVDARLYYHSAYHVMDNFSLRQPSGMAMEMPLERQTWGGRLQSQWRWGEQQLTAGVDAQQSDHEERTGHGWQQDAGFTQAGVFAEHRWPLAERHALVSGARLDWVRVKDYRDSIGGGHGGGMNHPNPTADQHRQRELPSAFLRYELELDAGRLVYAGLGHAQRMPDYWELFSPDAGPAGSVNAFSGLGPEKTTQLDVGVQWQQGDWRSWVAAYAGYIEDFVLFTSHQMGGMRHVQVSAVDADVAGAETGLVWQWHPHWSVDVALAYARGRQRHGGGALPQMPPLDGRLGLQYEREQWSAGLLWRAVAAQHRVAPMQGNVVGQDFGRSAGFGTLAVNGAYRFDESLTLSAGVDNVLDKAYSEHLNKAGSAGFGYPADTRINEPGRQYWVKVDLRF